MAQSTTSTSKTTANGNGNGNMSSKETSYSDLNKEIESLKSDLASLTNTLANLGVAEKDRLVETAKAKGQEFRAEGERHLHELQTTAEGYLRDGERYVRQQPGQALGLAAAIGFLIGFLFSRR